VVEPLLALAEPALLARSTLTMVAPLPVTARHVPRVPGPQVAPPPAQPVL